MKYHYAIRQGQIDLSVLRGPERSEEVSVRWTLLGNDRSGAKKLECSSPAGLDLTKKDIHRMSFLLKESARRDSNPRPRPWQGRAPPTEPLAHRLLCRSCLPDTFDIIQQELQFVNTKFEIFMQIEAVRRNQYPERSKETWSKTRRVNPHERMGQWNKSVIKKYV